MKIVETRFINKPNVLTVLVLLVLSEGAQQWHTKDFDLGTEKSVLEGIENGSLQPVMWEEASFVEDFPFGVGLDPRTPEQIQADNERHTAEMSAHINKVFETIKPHLLEVFGEKTREKYMAAALTGLLANERLTKLSPDEIADLAVDYVEAVILLNPQIEAEFGKTEQIFDPTC